MPFTQPIRSNAYDPLVSVVEMWFSNYDPAAPDDNAPYGRFLVRGGICWPEWANEHGTVEGAVVVVAYNLELDRAFVMAEQDFVCIAHIIEPRTHRLLHRGLAHWFAWAWSCYLADTFYFHQPDEVCHRWATEIRGNQAIQPEPVLVPLNPAWGDVRAAETLVWDWLSRRRIEGIVGGLVSKAIKGHARGKADRLPAILHALAAALCGMVTVIPEAKDVSQSPRARREAITNALMAGTPRDWHDEE